MPYLETDGLRIHYAVRGKGSPALFIHHYFGNSDAWQAQADALSRYYRVISVDLRAHGRSGLANGRLRMVDMAEDIRRLLTTLDVGPAHLIGASLGGLISLHLAREQAEIVRSAIVVGPPLLSEPTTAEYATRFITEIFPKDEARFDQAHPSYESGHARSVLLSNFERDRDEKPQPMVDAVQAANLIACPVLVVAGDQDEVFPVDGALALARRIPAGELCVLPHGGHFPHRMMPAIFTDILLDFLLRVDRRMK